MVEEPIEVELFVPNELERVRIMGYVYSSDQRVMIHHQDDTDGVEVKLSFDAFDKLSDEVDKARAESLSGISSNLTPTSKSLQAEKLDEVGERFRDVLSKLPSWAINIIYYTLCALLLTTSATAVLLGVLGLKIIVVNLLV